ncbi:MAG: ABC transporter substrate-binding protein [Chloroflexi bacterium]|nr:ABC transporter substrate-binding protein [Chloroflexota bacterium]
MSQHSNYWTRRITARRVTRRTFVAGIGLAGVGAAGLALVGCGDDDDSKKTTTTGGKTTNVSSLTKMLSLPSGKEAGQGLTLKVGAVLALSESGAYYGGTMSKGIDLAVEQIKSLGGPTFTVSYKDHKSGNAEAGAAAARELGIANTPMVLASYAADIGAMLPAIKQYKMLTLDGGGGAPPAFQGQPYFYGTRAVTPDDTFPGVYQYVPKKFPNAKKVLYVIWDVGDAVVKPSEANLQATLTKNGLTYLGMETAPIGTTDYSTLLARIKQKNADIIQLGIWGLDPGFFMKQYDTAGINAQVIGSEFTPDAAKVAGAAYDKYIFSFDFFDIDNPPNPWGKLFVDSFKAKYPDAVPDFYAADFYENTFSLWDLVRRVVAKNGDPNSGDQLDQALQANPIFKSVYGGDANTPGELGIDVKTHSVSKRALGVFTVKGGKTSMAASFDIGGASFKMM